MNPLKAAHARFKASHPAPKVDGGTAWARSTGYTSEQVAAALDALAARESGFVAAKHAKVAAWIRKTGRFTQWMLMLALDELVRICGICGGPALYRYGTAGRCREHKAQRPEWAEARERRFAVAHALLQSEFLDRDRRDVVQRHFRSGYGKNRRRK